MRKSLKKALKFAKKTMIVDSIGECDGIPRCDDEYLGIAKDIKHWVNNIDKIHFNQLLGSIFYFNGIDAPPFENFTFGETVADSYNYQDFCDHNGGWEIELVSFNNFMDYLTATGDERLHDLNILCLGLPVDENHEGFDKSGASRKFKTYSYRARLNILKDLEKNSFMDYNATRLFTDGRDPGGIVCVGNKIKDVLADGEIKPTHYLTKTRFHFNMCTGRKTNFPTGNQVCLDRDECEYWKGVLEGNEREAATDLADEFHNKRAPYKDPYNLFSDVINPYEIISDEYYFSTSKEEPKVYHTNGEPNDMQNKTRLAGLIDCYYSDLIRHIYDARLHGFNPAPGVHYHYFKDLHTYRQQMVLNLVAEHMELKALEKDCKIVDINFDHKGKITSLANDKPPQEVESGYHGPLPPGVTPDQVVKIEDKFYLELKTDGLMHVKNNGSSTVVTVPMTGGPVSQGYVNQEPS